MKDHSVQGYLERLPTEYLEGILLTKENKNRIADFESVRAIILEIIQKRQKENKE